MAEVLSPAAYALLEAIAKTESAGDWNVIYGGSKFDSYDDHPRKYVKIKSGPNKGRFSSAAGKYQILASTYDRVAPRLGITDFSPESQLRIAWYLAEDAYGPNLERDLQSGDPATIAKVGKALNDVWTSLPAGIEQGQTSNKFIKNFSQAMSTRAGMKVPGMLGDDPPRILEGIKDREAVRLGYGALPPSTPRPRPAYFNETGKPPVPLTRPAPPPSLAEQTGVKPLDPNMSPALQSARARLEAARQAKAGVDTPEALAVTPRLKGVRGQVTGIEDTRPPLDWAEFKPGMDVGGRGSLLDSPVSPAAPNPVKPPVAGLRLPVAPASKMALRPFDPSKDTPRANADGSISTEVTRTVQLPSGEWTNVPSLWFGGDTPRDFGAMTDDQLAGLAERYEQQSGQQFPRFGTVEAAERAAVERSEGGGATVTPLASRPSTTIQPNAKAVPYKPEVITAPLPSGKMVEIGKSYIVGNKLMQAQLGEDGKATLRNVEDIRDDWMRENIDANAPAIFDKGWAGAAARGIAAPLLKSALSSAGDQIKTGIGNTLSSVRDTVTGAASQAGNFLTSFADRAVSQPAPAKPANTLGFTYAGQEAAPKANTLKPVTSTIRNPEYDAWLAKYGGGKQFDDGSQIQTAATGAQITAKQLAAMQSLNGLPNPAITPPIPATRPPPAPPKTITVSKPAYQAPAPAPKPQTFKGTTGRTYTVGQTYIGSTGIKYTAQPNGTFQKVAAPVSTAPTARPAVKTATSTTAPSSAAKYAAAAAKSVDKGVGGAGGNPTWW